jgi:hypothetical protein
VADAPVGDSAGIVVGLYSNGLVKIRAHPIGVPPVVDGLNVQAAVEADKLASLLSIVLNQTPRLGGVSIFPYGIPYPEVFQVNVTLGNRWKQATSPKLAASSIGGSSRYGILALEWQT